MTTIAQLIGWDPLTQTAQDTTAALESVKPDDYPLYAPDANALGTDIRSAYADALATKEHAEHIQDCAFLERASDFVQLHDQVEASTQLLDELSSFLSTFQRDLYAVSNHISDLQGRSKTIEARLEARKAVERLLHPFVASITIPPSLISTITESDINSAFIAAVYDLDARLGAIRGGARVESRRALDDVAEGLRVTAAAKILPHLVSLLKPYTVSITPSLPSLHTRLLALKPLFDFLRRHAARQAHEFQKAYVQTVRWYLETAFRRYVRALEKIRTSSTSQQQQSSEPIGTVNAGVDASLALLQQRRSAQQQSQARSRSQHPNDARSSATTVALDHARIDGPNVIQAHQANDRNFHPSPEELFRSCALVLASNAASEYAFISAFFGQHSTLEVGSTSANSQFDGMRRRSSASASASASVLGSAIRERERSVDVDSDGGQTVGAPRQTAAASAAATPGLRRMASSVSGTTSLHSRAVQEEKVQRVVVDGLWKQVMEPALEYTRNFINALLDPVPPSTISLLAMVRLNDSLLTDLASTTTAPDTDSLTPSHTPVSDNSDGGGGGGSLPPCPALEPHLLAVRMQLLPILSKLMSAHVDSLRRINGSPVSLSSGGGGGGGGVGGMFARATGAVVGGAAGGGGSVKDSVVKVVIGRYAELFTAAVALWSNIEEPAASGGAADEDAEEAARRAKPVDGDDEMAFASLLRIRQEVDKLLAFQASKQADPAKRRTFMVAHCQELLHDLSAGHSSHPRTQAEVAHYRELARKAGP
ncbi:Vps52-domain-containing protein [Rhodotorula sp. JG-1b]|nr:Vps52-domain-containing protein [Rhodotorula sp. JG-1b]